MRLVIPLAMVSFVFGCDGLSLDAYWRSERYILLAVDTKSQMTLAFTQENGTALGLVDSTVFSLGSNEKFIVAMQHPCTKAIGGIDRSVTNYFVVTRTDSLSYDVRQRGVRGPMSKTEFDKIAATEPLPKFDILFEDLK